MVAISAANHQENPMKALVLRQDAKRAAKATQALINKGFQVVCVETRQTAHALISLDTVDLVVMDEQVNGRLTHSLALWAEHQNPYVSTIFLTDRAAADTDELYELIPSLYGILGTKTEAGLLGRLALSSVENVAEAEARVKRNAARVSAWDEDAVAEAALALEIDIAASEAADEVEATSATQHTLPTFSEAEGAYYLSPEHIVDHFEYRPAPKPEQDGAAAISEAVAAIKERAERRQASRQERIAAALQSHPIPLIFNGQAAVSRSSEHQFHYPKHAQQTAVERA